MAVSDGPHVLPGTAVFITLGYMIPLIYIVGAYEKDCDYLDPSQKDNTNYLQCQHSGCCGSFTERHCCRGPIVPVLITFGVVIGTLIFAVIISVCYLNYKQTKRQKSQTIPEIQTEAIPVPSPVRAPPVYNKTRLQPPTFTPQPFRTPIYFLEQEQHPPPSFLHPPRFAKANNK